MSWQRLAEPQQELAEARREQSACSTYLLLDFLSSLEARSLSSGVNLRSENTDG
jgi:hypothetical protein